MGHTLLDMGLEYWEQADIEFNKYKELVEKRAEKTGENWGDRIYEDESRIQRQKEYIRAEEAESELYQKERVIIPKESEQRRTRQTLNKLIKAIEGIDGANVIVVWPDPRLFSSEKPITASVMITPKPGSDIHNNRKKIENIVKIFTSTVDGLKDENIVIFDRDGVILNDFE
jgi:hypothetical protein